MGGRIRRSGRVEELRARRILARLLASVLLFSGFPPAIAGQAAASRPQAEEFLQKVRARWQAQKSLTARIEQVQQFAGFDEPVKSRGKLSILRPRYFDLVFDPPHRQRQVCDGTWVWTYMEEQKQVLKSPLAQDATRGADLLEWAMEGAVANSAVPDTSFGADAIRLSLAPGAHLPLRELSVWAKESTGDVLGVDVADTEGNRTRLRLFDVRTDRRLAPEQFRFAPPAGTEVIELGKQE